MKLKEYFPSILKSFALKNKSVSRIKSRNKNTVPLIVSLTTIPSRLKLVQYTVRSLLCANPQPDKIILWLNEDLESAVPAGLKALEGDVFEIRYSPYTFSHRKLIHSLELFSDRIIVTVDDDVMYHPNLLGQLYKSHLEYPKDIIANRVRSISYNEQGEVLPYKQWKHVTSSSIEDMTMMPVGVCGVLYPVGALNKQVLNVDLFQELSPKSDDLWFKTMALLNGTLSRFAPYTVEDPTPLVGSQKVALKKTNVNEDRNRVQWENLALYFNIDLKEM